MTREYYGNINGEHKMNTGVIGERKIKKKLIQIYKFTNIKYNISKYVNVRW